MRGEPVRGALPDPGFFSLSGFEQAEALRRDLVPRPPLAHLTGLTVTGVGPGRATLTLPASPWFESGDGLAIEVLAEAALSTSVLAAAPPGSDLCTTAMSVAPFRSATPEAATLIAQAEIVRTGPTFVYAEASVSDDLGRQIARVSGAVRVRSMDPPPPPAPPLRGPVDVPVYSVPDPYLRSLPPGVAPVSRAVWEGQDGLSIIRLMRDEEIRLPVGSLFGIRPVEADRGRMTVGLVASEWLCLRRRQLMPGSLSLTFRQLLTGTSQTLGAVGSRVGVVNLTVAFHRPVVPDGRELIAAGRVTHHEDDLVVTSGEMTDVDGRLIATAYETCVLLPLRPRPPARAEPILATVLFTDLVGSTARAREIGDEPWRQLLEEHEHDVRRRLQAFSGREVKSMGDGFLAAFDSPARAARCAREILMDTRRLGLTARAAIHTGECQLAAGDITGIAVHLASRVLDAARPDEVLVSGTVRDLLLGSELRFVDRGRHKLKGIDGEWQLFGLDE